MISDSLPFLGFSGPQIEETVHLKGSALPADPKNMNFEKSPKNDKSISSKNLLFWRFQVKRSETTNSMQNFGLDSMSKIDFRWILDGFRAKIRFRDNDI